MHRIRGRNVYPGTLEERRILLGFGVQDIRVPRGMNPMDWAEILALFRRA